MSDDVRWYTELDAVGLAAAIRSGERSPVEAVEAALARIAAVDDTVHACAEVLAERARAEARVAERAVAEGRPLGPLHGVPIAVKDVVWVEGTRATMGTRGLADFVAPADAAAVRRLRAAGAVVVARTTNPEFLWRGYCADSLHGITRNPWDPERTPAATSGGSAAAVTTGMVPLALGTDAAGSIRLPAAFCGVVGHKPTHGLVPRTPGFDELRSTNVVGPLTRSVRDAVLATALMAGPDPSDDLASPHPPGDLVAAVADVDVPALRLAWAPELSGPLEPAVAAVFAQVVDRLGAAGWTVDVLALPPVDLTDFAHPTLLGEVRVPPELRRDRVSGYGAALLAAAESVDPEEFAAAQRERARFTADWDRLVAGYDAVLTPAAADVAPRFGPDRTWPDTGRIGYTALADLTGKPATAVPIGATGGLPLGLEVLADRGRDDLCLAIADAVGLLLPDAVPRWHPTGSGSTTPLR